MKIGAGTVAIFFILVHPELQPIREGLYVLVPGALFIWAIVQGIRWTIKKARMHKAILEQYRQPSEPYRNPFE